MVKDKEKAKRLILKELARRGLDIDQVRASLRAPSSLKEFVEKTTGHTLDPWQIQLCEILEEYLINRKGVRLLLHAMPQIGKSIIVSKRTGAYILGKNPMARIVVAGYNLHHTTNILTEPLRNVMQTPEYRTWFPDASIPDVCSSEHFTTSARKKLNDGQASVTALGIQTGFTGKGLGAGDVLIIDDPYASPEDAASETINSKTIRFWTDNADQRVHPDANVVIMFHRYHGADLAGELMKTGKWEYIRFPAIADGEGYDPTGRSVGEVLSPRLSLERLEEIKEKQPMVFYGQYQGLPQNPESALFKREDFKVGIIPPLETLVRYWDLAVSIKETGDYTVGALGGIGPNQVFYLKDIERFRMEWPDACQMIAQITEREYLECKARGVRYIVGVDSRLSQQGFFQQLMKLQIFQAVPLWPDKSIQDKKTRASGWAALARTDRFRMALGAWNHEFIEECLCFDGLGIAHDDQVDAVSGLHDLIWQIKGETVAETKRTTEEGFTAERLLSLAGRAYGA